MHPLEAIWRLSPGGLAAVLAAGVGLLLLLWLVAVVLGQRRSLASMEARMREDAEVQRRLVVEFDRGLRQVVAESAARGLETAFDRVQEGAREQGVQLQRFGLAMQASLTELRTETADRLRAGFDRFADGLRAEQEALRGRVDAKLEEIRAGNEAKLEQMRAAVDQQLQSALEKRVGESFRQVAEQFAQVQQAIGQVQTVAGQVGDLKRLFSNVRARGVWGEAQLEAVLEEVLPAGYERAFRVREGTGEAVEFALRMPLKDRDEPVYLAVDSKFPTEDYDRLLLAAEAADRDAEQAARRGLERCIREEGARIGRKYIVPPRTVDFAVMYLPTEGLFSEVNRLPGLLEFVRREHRVMVIGPSLLPALLHTIRIGQLTMVIERRSSEIARMLGAVRAEWGKLNRSLDAMADRAEKLSRSIDDTRVRTRQVGKKLGGVLAAEADEADRLLGLEGPGAAEPVGEEVEGVE